MNNLVRIFGIEFSNVTLPEAANDIVNLAINREKGLILPVNVDQVITFNSNKEIKRIYSNALRIYADGMPIVWLSKLKRSALKERVTGSDLTPEICRICAKNNVRIFLLGAAPGVADLAASKLKHKYSGLDIVGTYSPPYGFENDNNEIDRAIRTINQTMPDILFVALGFPKQEIFADKYLTRLDVGPIISIGATLDFIAGDVRRAPKLFRDNGLEWLWRFFQEPRRLWRRYLIRGPRFLIIAIKELFIKANLNG